MIMVMHIYYVVIASWKHVKIDVHDRMTDEIWQRHALV